VIVNSKKKSIKFSKMKRSRLTLVVLFLSTFICEFSPAQDMWGFSRYTEANEKIATPANGEKRVVFMGNSITDGWSNARPDFFAGKPYINRGIAGQTTPQMLVRFRADVINLKPSVVVILAGTNDIAENMGPSKLEWIENNILSMVQLAQTNGIKVILCSLLPAFDYPWKPGLHPAEKIVALNKILKADAKKYGLIWVDYFSPMADERNGLKAEYSGDGVHPNEAGYSVMEPLVEKAIAKALQRRK
jgi:lysophospholipase L1-like esterase